MVIFMVSAVAMTACHHSDEPEPPKPPDTISRTVLVYMVANNNLGSASLDRDDLEEMSLAASQGDLNGGRLLVYHSSSKGNILKEITKEGVDTLKQYDNSEYSVSISRVQQVITDMKSLAPADDYGMVLWSHASGWIQDGIAETTSDMFRSFGSDGSTRKKMNITSLREALKDTHFKFIYFDCCYMGSVETLYELRDCAEMFVASSAEIHPNGMPYHKNLKYFFSKTLDTEEALTQAAESSYDFYNSEFTPGQCPVTFAAVRASALDDLAKATRDIYRSASALYDPDCNYQRFQTGTCYYFDLREYVESICTDPTLMEAWDSAMANTVLYSDASSHIWNAFPIHTFCGLSSYIITNPSNIYTKNYYTLSWYNDVAKYLPL